MNQEATEKDHQGSTILPDALLPHRSLLQRETASRINSLLSRKLSVLVYTNIYL